VLDWVKRSQDVVERDLRAADLLRAVSLAVTNSRLGVMSVARIDRKKLPSPHLALELSQNYLRAHGLLRNA
jgi:branched-subunit amino acid aminotransferase/4-amino-4-deoxychorismate lyase